MRRINTLNSVLKIANYVRKNQIILKEDGLFKRIYSVNPEDEKIEEIVVAGVDMEREAYVVKVRMENPFLKDEFFGDESYRKNKAIFDKIDHAYDPDKSVKSQGIQTMIIG